MSTHTDPEVLAEDGESTNHETAEDITIAAVRCRWKGKSSFSVQAGHREGSPAYGSCSDCYWAYTGWTTVPALSGMEAFVSGYLRVTVTNRSGGGRYLFADRIDQGGNVVGSSGLQGPIADGQSLVWDFPLSLSDCGRQNRARGGPTSLGAADVACYARIDYSVTTETKTANPSAECNGQTCSLTAVLNDGQWSAYQAAPAGFLSVGENSVDHDVGGSGEAGFVLQYDYTRNVPTPLAHKKIKTPAGVLTLVLCSPEDPWLLTPCRRASIDGIVYCYDLVPVTDPEASPRRVSTQHGILAYRKVV